ncbi:MAG: archaeal flagellar protein FlaF [Methanohalophilus sp. T328-1]|jgi:flagellar protein FlaF|uniref:flagellar protein FlaF n=1 Tax=Methanohalophilus sp. DAL1 TaxID=1864608 RepID=UPI000798F6A8|nr:flagellar protein FlaF [Methanohalophilus sp. DAL1]KXS46387.1 MAG: archaeal flagellar protein FlaF [Methanohalophilus sp. T328-1]OBZ35487.1 MAG: flagellar protein FlaF [Methanohalophilus sp. DAL1]
MGLDTVIVAFFVLTTMLVVANTFAMGANEFVDSAYDGYTSMHTTTMEKLQTDITIQYVWYNSSGNEHLHFTVANTGETKLYDFDMWDVIVVKNGTAQYMDYSQWIYLINEGQLNPDILDPREDMDIEILATYETGDKIVLKVATPNGVTSSEEYTIGG